MDKPANGSWHVRKIIGEVVGIMAADSTIIAELPQGKKGWSGNHRSIPLAAAPRNSSRSAPKSTQFLRTTSSLHRKVSR
jgi:hypothetical protein